MKRAGQVGGTNAENKKWIGRFKDPSTYRIPQRHPPPFLLNKSELLTNRFFNRCFKRAIQYIPHQRDKNGLFNVEAYSNAFKFCIFSGVPERIVPSSF